MALYRRGTGKTWWVDIALPGGRRHRESTKTENKQLAQAFHDQLKVALWKQDRLGIKKERKFEEAVDLFLQEKRNLRSLSDYQSHCDWWLTQFAGRNLSAITQDVIVETIKRKEVEGISPSTCNRYMATLRAILRLACLKYQWIERVPTFFMNKEPRGRTRWLRPEEIPRLLEQLAPLRRDMTVFSLATGLRQGNVLGLKWSQVDLARKLVVISGDEMKAGRDHALPLPEVAVQVLTRQIGRHDVYVFAKNNGEPVKSSSNAEWRKACERAGIEDFRQHDLRHTWATTLVQSGVPDGVLQALGAWETPKMVKRYAHHSADSMRKFTGQIDEVLGGLGDDAPKVTPLRLVG